MCNRLRIGGSVSAVAEVTALAQVSPWAGNFHMPWRGKKEKETLRNCGFCIFPQMLTSMNFHTTYGLLTTLHPRPAFPALVPKLQP